MLFGYHILKVEITKYIAKNMYYILTYKIHMQILYKKMYTIYVCLTLFSLHKL